MYSIILWEVVLAYCRIYIPEIDIIDKDYF